MAEQDFRMIAKTMQGLEQVLATELRGVEARNVTTSRRAVYFDGDMRTLYRANLECRTALRVLKHLFTFEATSPEDLYRAFMRYDWGPYLRLRDTFAIDSVVFSEHFSHNHFVSLKAKDAIVDQFRKRYNRRPSIDTDKPTIRIHIFIQDKKVEVSLDSSGGSLHRRGYRIGQNKAPISEVLAAGMLKLAGYEGKGIYVDPMCGSGTILIEAAMIALNRPINVNRYGGFAFERWRNFNAEIWKMIRTQAFRQMNEVDPPLIGGDISQRTLGIAEKNVEYAKLGREVELHHSPFQELEVPEGPGLVVINPPYGERMGTEEEIAQLYAEMGKTLKERYKGYDAWIITSNPHLLKRMDLWYEQSIPLRNGSLDCQFVHYKIS
ncbi:THUMP domain-containing protein [Pontibacter sp. G13]|uniref:THUMP domain-containing class I SAM-dependent RNA methyltransferase n=1 Tax=Pontibacter sp. G13 TaxID=3074898 RepID=UPI00288BA338|nr:THUMP domain-containing protein [Pontibacter sp. G13]WNJ16699.1 THUMP domain-containing protein [Pontibacter sp. G13]